jgi:beta-mannanase
MIRYASEMNGSWFLYGQKPTEFIREWNRLVNAVRNATDTTNVAFLWAPNSGNGYPYMGGDSSVNPSMPSFDKTLDTNHDGLFNNQDDPYTPYYPGDDMVMLN